MDGVLIESRLKKVEVDIDYLQKAHEEHKEHSAEEARKSSQSRKELHEKGDKTLSLVYKLAMGVMTTIIMALFQIILTLIRK